MICGHDDCFTCPFADCIVDGSKIITKHRSDTPKDRRKYDREYYNKHKEEIRKRQHEYYLRRKNEQLRMDKEPKSY